MFKTKFLCILKTDFHCDIVSPDDSVSFVIPREQEPGLLIPQGNRLDILQEKNGQQTTFVPATALGLPDKVVTNDGKCDARGRLWFGKRSKLHI